MDNNVVAPDKDNKHKKKRKDKKDKSKKNKKRSRIDEENESPVAVAAVHASTHSDIETEKQSVTDDGCHSGQANDLTKDPLVDDRMVVSSALEFLTEEEIEERRKKDPHTVTLLLFYQYVEPPWSATTYETVKERMNEIGTELKITGRMRVAKEGLNCTLTGTWMGILQYCQTLRSTEFENRFSFTQTEFKLTRDLPQKQAFPSLKIIPVIELVNYGLDPNVAPIDNLVRYTGVHLEPKDYHEKLAQDNTVVIDVRNHYEAKIGRFVPPTEDCQYIDPLMRKSTEFPFWLQKPETQEALKGKQVLMYCTGGVRCERATALLKYKMETDESIKALNIQGVFQLQGGIDKYFREFPDGGFWKGKNYTFDKRFAHAPAKVAAVATSASDSAGTQDNKSSASATLKPEEKHEILGHCEACDKPWDMYRGKRRCPTCGVPSLICRECFEADKNGIRKLGRSIRCDLCVQEGITSKAQLKAQDEAMLQQKHKKSERHKSKSSKTGVKGALKTEGDDDNIQPAPNPEQTTRLCLKNLCRKNTDEESLVQALLPQSTITHIVWRNDHRTGQFLGQAWVEMKSPLDAAYAVARDGHIALWGRPIYITYQPPDGKDLWPPPHSAVGESQDY